MIHQISNITKIETTLKKAFSESGAADSHSLIAISGGPDSSALIVSLSKLSYKVSACHVNHHLRGEESDRDQEFCQSLCKKLGIELVVKHAQQTSNSENSLRDERYRLLSQTAQELNCSFIATAHTLDDQAETVLFRLLRGSGPNGLRGIPRLRQLNENQTIIRPFLSISRDWVQSLLTEEGISACLDSSNDESTYTRNFIRHEILPVIEKRFGGAKERLAQFAQIELEEFNYWKPLVEKSLEDLKSLTLPFSLSYKDESQETLCWDKKKFEKFPEALKRRILHESLQQKEIEASFARIEAILEAIANNSNLSLNTFWQVETTKDFIVWHKTPSTKACGNQDQGKTKAPPLPIYAISVPGVTLLPALNKAFKVTPYQTTESTEPITYPARHAFEAIVDLSHIKSGLTIRLRQPGDRVRPFGMTNLVKLKKYLHGLNSSLKLRSKLQPTIVVCDGEEIVWIPGLGLSNKIAVTSKPTHHLVLLDLEPDSNFFA